VAERRTLGFEKEWPSHGANIQRFTVESSLAEPHHFYAAPAPGNNFDATPAPAAPAPAPTLLYSKTKF
jgi:hypothetical protein